MLPTFQTKTLPTPTAEDAQVAKMALDRVRITAAINAELLLEKITVRALDDTASFRNVLEAYNANKEMALAGQKQQEQKQGTAFKIIFEMGDTAPTLKTVTIEQEPDVLDNKPAYVSMIPAVNSELIVEIDDE